MYCTSQDLKVLSHSIIETPERHRPNYSRLYVSSIEIFS